MKNRILASTILLFICLWAIGIPLHLGAPEIPGKLLNDSKAIFPARASELFTGVSFIDKFLSQPHPAETIVEYGERVKTKSLNVIINIWTKGIKDPCVEEYEYIVNLSNKMILSLKLDSLLNKVIEFFAKISGQLLASC